MSRYPAPEDRSQRNRYLRLLRRIARELAPRYVHRQYLNSGIRAIRADLSAPRRRVAPRTEPVTVGFPRP